MRKSRAICFCDAAAVVTSLDVDGVEYPKEAKETHSPRCFVVVLCV